MHCNKSLLGLLFLNIVGDINVVEVLLLLVCFVVFVMDQGSFSTYSRIIAKLAIPFYISFYLGISLTYCSWVCRLWNKGWLKALKFPLVVSVPSSFELFISNFSISSLVSRCCLCTHLSLLLKCSLSMAIAIFFLCVVGHFGGACALSPLPKVFLSPWPSHTLSFSLLSDLSFSPCPCSFSP